MIRINTLMSAWTADHTHVMHRFATTKNRRENRMYLNNMFDIAYFECATKLTNNLFNNIIVTKPTPKIA